VYCEGYAYFKQEEQKMLIKDAKAITGDIGFTTKTGFAFGLQARTACKIGSKLCKKEGSTCFGCYARGGNYAYPSVKTAHGRRLIGVMKQYSGDRTAKDMLQKIKKM